MFKLKDNIQKLYLANFLTGLVFWYGIEKLFMTEIGISPFGVSIVAATFFVIVLLFDIPSGVLADKWNRKYTLILALLMLAISTIIFGVSNGVGPYLFGIVFYGFYVVLTSGTYQAIMYDSLHEIGLHKRYDKYQGKAYAMFLVGVTAASLISGHIANSFGYRSVFFITIVSCIFTILVLTTLIEPKFHKLSSESKFFDHIDKSRKIVFSNSFLLHLAVFSVLSRILLNLLNEYGGLYFIALGFLAVYSGYANAAQGLFAAFGEVIAEKIGRKALYLVPILMISFILFSFIDSILGLPFFYAAVFLQSVLNNQTEAEFQDNTPSEIRATTLSMLGFTANAILIPLGLLFGYIAEVQTVFSAYRFFAIIGLIYVIYWLVFFLPKLRHRLNFEKTSNKPKAM